MDIPEKYIHITLSKLISATHSSSGLLRMFTLCNLETRASIVRKSYWLKYY